MIIAIIVVLCLLYHHFYFPKNKIEIEHMSSMDNFDQMTIDEKNACVKLRSQTRIFKKNMIKQIIYSTILKKTKKALDQLDIPFFLSSGTLLGQIRENKFLDHDYDIDIGIFKEDYTPAIISKMASEGLIFYRALGNLDDGLELSFRLKGTKLGKWAKIDIFLHYRNGNSIYWVSYLAPRFKKKIKYQVTNFILKPVKFMDVKVNVPYPTLKYVREHYGENWYVPTKVRSLGGSYDYRYSPKSIVE